MIKIHELTIEDFSVIPNKEMVVSIMFQNKITDSPADTFYTLGNPRQLLKKRR